MYAALHPEVRTTANRAYKLFLRNPSHPGLNFKKVEGRNDIYSARVGRGYRALARVEGEEIVWFWIGPHSDYDRLVG